MKTVYTFGVLIAGCTSFVELKPNTDASPQSLVLDGGQVSDGCASGDRIYFPDCDSDGYAAPGAIGVRSCGIPQMAPQICPWGSWTDDATRLNDCADSDFRAHPGSNVHFETTPIKATHDYDFDCDGMETKAYGVIAGWNFNASDAASCIGGPFIEGWVEWFTNEEGFTRLVPVKAIPSCGRVNDQVYRWAIRTGRIHAVTDKYLCGVEHVARIEQPCK